jgi:hypothetical protein
VKTLHDFMDLISNKKQNRLYNNLAEDNLYKI